jgi:hypothetical protein
VFGPDEEGSPADDEFVFALAAINAIRAQCDSSAEFKGQYPPVTASDVTIYDDECRSRVVSGQTVITLSFDVPAASGSDNEVDGVYVLISTSKPVDDPEPNQTKPDVQINAEGYAADFRLLGIRKYDDDSGGGDKPWSCDYSGSGTPSPDFDPDAIDDDETYSDDPNATPMPEVPARRRASLPVSHADDTFERTLVVGGRQYLPDSAVPMHEAHALHAHRRRIEQEDTLLTDAEKADIMKGLPTNLDARALPLPSGVTTPPMITVPTDQGGCVHEADIMRHVVMPGV